MKIKALATLAVLLVAAAALTSWPPSADGLGCYRCPIAYSETSGQWGFGSTCAEADSNAIARASALIACTDGTCEEIPVQLSPCSLVSPGQYRSTWKIRYKCQIYICS